MRGKVKSLFPIFAQKASSSMKIGITNDFAAFLTEHLRQN
nr:hypothetical protein [Escherichia coli]